ncbi:hypothetical protein H4582DRAFT_2076083 [Lactarius indigo]|nr:hypothetical protein H4582DRAFT_2076083 [Lactarius indigo]
MSDIQKASKEKDIDMSIKDVHLTFTGTYTGISDPEDDASSGLESFDEDDMYGSDNGDDIICNIPDTDEESQELEHSLDRLNELINASQTLWVNKVINVGIEVVLWPQGNIKSTVVGFEEKEGSSASTLMAHLILGTLDLVVISIGVEAPSTPPSLSFGCDCWWFWDSEGSGRLSGHCFPNAYTGKIGVPDFGSVGMLVTVW